METLLQYLPYILGAAIALLILVCLFDVGGVKKHTEPQRPKQRYYHRRHGGTPVH
jgi:hypothetical protein